MDIWSYRKTDEGYRITVSGVDAHGVCETEEEAKKLIKRLNVPLDFGWGFDQFPEDDGEPTNAPDATTLDKEAEGRNE